MLKTFLTIGALVVGGAVAYRVARHVVIADIVAHAASVHATDPDIMQMNLMALIRRARAARAFYEVDQRPPVAT